VAWTLSDQLGTIRTYVTLAGTTGEVTAAEQLIYSAFGEEEQRFGNDVGTDEILIAPFTGREYDAAAIAGIAHGLATGRTLTPADIPGGSEGAGKALTRLGFDVRDDSPPGASKTRTPPKRAAAPRAGARAGTPSTPRPRVVTIEKPDTLCPRCFIAVPATGICDSCD